MWLVLIILGLAAIFGVKMFLSKQILETAQNKANAKETRGFGSSREAEFVYTETQRNEILANGKKLAGLSTTLGSTVGGLFIIIGILMTSFVFVSTSHTAHMIKKYGGSHLPVGRVIAVDGEMGRQSRLLQEGINFQPFINVIYEIEQVPNVVIEPGKVGLLTSIDGIPLDQSKDEFIAPDWVSASYTYDGLIDSVLEENRTQIEKNMLDPEYFLNHNGRKGPQLNVLPPGEYKLNRYLWKVTAVPATDVPAGFVGVIVSKVGETPEDIELSAGDGNLAQPVVDKGYRGVWKEVLTPGTYYLNTNAFKVELFDTRVQTWVYAGGYKEKTIDLEIGEDGEIKQKIASVDVAVPSNAAGDAIDVKSKDGWILYCEGRMVIQVEGEDAPYIYASVGSMENLENRIITPILRSDLRNQGENRQALDFWRKRSHVEESTTKIVQLEGEKARVTIKDWKMAKVVIPPELLVPAKRQQLANQMKTTYETEKQSYEKRKIAQRSKELADQQGTLVAAEIANQAADQKRLAREKEGRGEKAYMINLAEGQRAQAEVLGIDKTVELQMLKMMLESENMQWNTPNNYVNVVGGGGTEGLEAAKNSSVMFMAEEIKKYLANGGTVEDLVKANTQTASVKPKK